MSLTFALDPRLQESSLHLADLGLCQLRLQLDARFAWTVLVPQRDGARELDDLSEPDLHSLTQEILTAAKVVRAIGWASRRPIEKLNIAALGNVVAQLHIHVVGRRQDDAVWPAPVWGAGSSVAYDPDALRRVTEAARRSLPDPAS